VAISSEQQVEVPALAPVARRGLPAALVNLLWVLAALSPFAIWFLVQTGPLSRGPANGMAGAIPADCPLKHPLPPGHVLDTSFASAGHFGKDWPESNILDVAADLKQTTWQNDLKNYPFVAATAWIQVRDDGNLQQELDYVRKSAERWQFAPAALTLANTAGTWVSADGTQVIAVQQHVGHKALPRRLTLKNTRDTTQPPSIYIFCFDLERPWDGKVLQ